MLLWIEGFETFGNSTGQWAKIATKYYPDPNYYSGGGYYKLRDGRWGGYALETWDNDIHFTTLTLPTTDPTMVVGFNFRTAALADGNYNGPTLGFWDSTMQSLAVILRATGELSVYRGSLLLGTTTGANIQPGAWCHIEVKVYCHATSGSVTIRVNEVTKLSLTGINTKGGNDSFHSRVRFRGVNSACQTRFDDIFILDATGAVNNDFLGRKRVVAIFPNAIGDVAAWTPSAGDNWDCVDEQNPSTADYVQTAVTGNSDLYNFSAVAGITGGIAGIQINALSISTTDGMPWSLSLPVKPSGGSQDDGASLLVTSSSGFVKSRLLETNPASGVAWTTTDLNDAQFGVKLL